MSSTLVDNTTSTVDETVDAVEIRRCSKFRKAFSFLSVEPICFLLGVGFGLQIIMNQDLIISKVCNVNLNLTVPVCSNLSGHPDEQLSVQKLSATISMYMSILSALPSVIVSLFLGPWSDHNGRKPLIITPTVGYIVAIIFYFVNVYFKNLSAEFLLLTSLGQICGGYTCLLIGIYGYISDVTQLKTRTKRVAVISLFFGLAIPFGTFLSDYVFKLGGFYAIYGSALVLYLIALLYTIFFITEPRIHAGNEDVEVSADRQRKLLDIGNVVSVFKTVFKPREGGLRAVLWLLLLSMMLSVSTFYDGGTVYLYSRLKFSWTEEQFTLWSSVMTVLQAGSTFCFMPFIKRFHDSLIGLAGTLFAVAAQLIYAFSAKSWMFYLGGSMSCFSNLTGIVIRSMLSKVVPKTELGKVFSLLSSLESIVPLIFVPIVTNIYKATIDSYAGSIFIFYVFDYAIIGILLLSIYLILRHHNFGYTQLHDLPGADQDEVGPIRDAGSDIDDSDAICHNNESNQPTLSA